MEKIATHLWFDTQARQAAEWYVSFIPGSRVKQVTTMRNTPSGDVDVVSFDLAGRPFMAIGAGPLFKFNPSVSFQLTRPTVDGVDTVWNTLADGGSVLMPLDKYPFSERFGWVADKYGVSWQIRVAPDGAAESIAPMLMFTGSVAGKAEEAMTFYASVFRSAAPTILARYASGEAPDREGTVKYATFELREQAFAAMDSAWPHGFTDRKSVV